MIDDDGLDGEWSCPICGTVMHVIDGGYQCRGCGHREDVAWVERPRGGDDLPGLRA